MVAGSPVLPEDLGPPWDSSGPSAADLPCLCLAVQLLLPFGSGM